MANYLETDTTTGGAMEVSGLSTSTGVADAGKIPQLNAAGEIDASMIPNLDSTIVNASEALTAGSLVYIDGSGEAALASAATGGNKARGYVLTAAAAAAVVTVYFEGKITGLAGLTVGGTYFLSDTTAGGITTTAPADTGELLQSVGQAISATVLAFEPALPIKRA